MSTQELTRHKKLAYDHGRSPFLAKKDPAQVYWLQIHQYNTTAASFPKQKH